eukprot:CAMPEP_0206192394 /NCGR_PEP_ID=MMETSP0166-20121206/5933_1 /ASSEMBLY_ACC=CAM_ASM_000260 /TAXON_ID=95228 /ORGANISM="Vannella robusta, Strain DIVA3 518/3/11/1/6" /LENGTH=287 /DNA_ID=CAMNT_0053608883 /DNA_START=1252 /DNA_END=2115 /DNA_ORIENTATION=-
MSLKGRVAIVTGASRGIGREICLSLAREGCKVVAAAKTVEERPNLPGTVYSVAKEVEELGGEALPIQCDVRNDQSVERMIDETLKKFGRIDILINNAGALWWKDMVDTPMKRYDLINDVNSRGTFMCAKMCLPHMLKQGYGHIVNMSPPIDLKMLPGRIGYSISKFGMTLVAHGIGMELKGTGVACNALWPATMVESYATKNFNLGARSLWRKATIIADATISILKEDPKTFTGNALIDEDYMRSRGVTDFTKYRCDPDVEPPRLNEEFHNVQRGHVSEAPPVYSKL